jgi:DNA invertase Pin-like site-specific DNA recombinase
MEKGARLSEGRWIHFKELTDKGVTVEFVSEKLSFTGDDDKYATLMLHILGGVAQFERAIIKERQREGIELAKRMGPLHWAQTFPVT